MDKITKILIIGDSWANTIRKGGIGGISDKNPFTKALKRSDIDILFSGYDYVDIIKAGQLLWFDTTTLTSADFCFLLGYFGENEDETIIKILNENCRGKVIVTDGDFWGSFLEKHYPNSFKRFSRYAIKKEPNIFDKKKLNDFILAVEPQYQVVRIDELIYYKTMEDAFTADFCSFFSTLEEYLKHGIGYVIMDKNKKIFAGASSYTYCKGNIEITIGTIMEYRRKGLALACVSKLILECLDKNIYPRWDAANVESVSLAKKLGYNFEKEYIVYSI